MRSNWWWEGTPYEERRLHLFGLYFRSHTVKFGSFELSAHRDNPDLEKSPIYLHYPKPGEPGSELLEELYSLVGSLIIDFLLQQNPAVLYTHIAGVPKGADPLAEAFGERLGRWPDAVVKFIKDESSGTTVYELATAMEVREGAQLLVVEDHTSGGRNKKLFFSGAEKAGFEVTDMLTVVYRQQGAVEALLAMGVRLLYLSTLDEILDYGVLVGHITQETADEVRAYIARNQIG